MAKPNNTAAPLAYSFESLSAACTIAVTTLRIDAKSGLLKTRRKGTRYLILPEDARAYLEALPYKAD